MKDPFAWTAQRKPRANGPNDRIVGWDAFLAAGGEPIDIGRAYEAAFSSALTGRARATLDSIVEHLGAGFGAPSDKDEDEDGGEP